MDNKSLIGAERRIFWEEYIGTTEDEQSEAAAYVKMYKAKGNELVAYVISKNDINPHLPCTGSYLPLANSFGVYFLLGSAFDTNSGKSKWSVYVGRAFPRNSVTLPEDEYEEYDGIVGMKRLWEHAKPDTKDSYKDEWNKAVYITCTELYKENSDDYNGMSASDVIDIEKEFIRFFKHSNDINNCNCLNKQNGNNGGSRKRNIMNVIFGIEDLLSLKQFGGFKFKSELITETALSVLNSELVEAQEEMRKIQKSVDKQIADGVDQRVAEMSLFAQTGIYINRYYDAVKSVADADKYISDGRIIDERAAVPKTDSVITPDSIAKEMVELIPPEVFSSKSTFLDMYTKSGIYLELILRKLMDTSDDSLPINREPEFEDLSVRLKHIIRYQLFGLTPMVSTRMNTLKRLFDVIEDYNSSIHSQIRNSGRTHNPLVHMCYYIPNIIVVDKYSNLVKRAHCKSSIIQSLQNEFSSLYEGTGEEMKMQFDVVIGNPPYTRDIFLDFVNLGYDLSSQYTVMITPGKWQIDADDSKTSSNISYKEFREKLVKHIGHVTFFPACNDVFKIQQVDGITYYLLDKAEHETAIVENRCKHIPYYNSIEERSLLNRESLFNLGNEIVEYLGDYERFKFIVNPHGKYQVMTNTQTPGGALATLLASREVLFLGKSYIEERWDEYRGSSASKCTFSSDSKQECENFRSWLNTKFTQYFVSINISKLTGITDDDHFRFVPVPSPDTNGHPYGHPDFKFDHAYTDKELYEYYKLPQKYIDVIEAIVKKQS